jgi:hypothetical protein
LLNFADDLGELLENLWALLLVFGDGCANDLRALAVENSGGATVGVNADSVGKQQCAERGGVENLFIQLIFVWHPLLKSGRSRSCPFF